jgi:hypothetical protein
MTSRYTDKDQDVLDIYWKLLDFIPGLEDQTKWLWKVNPLGIRDLASFVRDQYFCV